MQNNVKEKLRTWLSAFPESTHPLDTHRLYDVVIAMEETDSTISEENIVDMLQEVKPNWPEEHSAEFAAEKIGLIYELKDFLSYLKEK